MVFIFGRHPGVFCFLILLEIVSLILSFYYFGKMLKPHWSIIKKLRIKVNFFSVQSSKGMENISLEELDEQDVQDEHEQLSNENDSLLQDQEEVELV